MTEENILEHVFPSSKCPMCNSYYEDVGTEVFKGKFRLEVCGNCGYTFDVEM